MHLKEYASTKLALGSDTTFVLFSTASEAINNQLFQKLWHTTFTFEKRFSRFIPMSELSTFNRSAGLKVVISPEFKEILTTARELAKQTEGLYNPFMLPAVQRAGYLHSAAAGYEADPVDDFTARQVVGIEHLEIGEDWARIPYGTAIDLGGCGKGYLAEQLRDLLNKDHIMGYWLSLGGDIATFGVGADSQQISVHVQNAQTISIDFPVKILCPTTEFAVATSGTFRRKNQQSKKYWHHIIDPRTLLPAETDILLATVACNNALDADVLASCAVILGSKKAPTFLKEHGAQGYILQGKDTNGYFAKQHGQMVVKSKQVKERPYA